jgi:hypothetical protein
MESFRQALGAVYFALAEAAGGDYVFDRASDILTDAVISGAIDDPYARAAVMAIVRSSTQMPSTVKEIEHEDDDGRYDRAAGPEAISGNLGRRRRPLFRAHAKCRGSHVRRVRAAQARINRT